MEYEVVEVRVDGEQAEGQETVRGRFSSRAQAEHHAHALARRYRQAGLRVHQDIRDQFWVAEGLRKVSAIVIRPAPTRRAG